MSLVYIAAPLGAPTPAHRAWNRERARILCALAFAMGAAPVCVHPYAELAIGSDTDPAAREKGLSLAVTTARKVASAGGRLWLLRRDDGTISHGCEAELNAWSDAHPDHGPQIKTWAEYRREAMYHAPHLLPEFDRLAKPPPGPKLTGVWEASVHGMRLPWMSDQHGHVVMCILWAGAGYEGAFLDSRTRTFPTIADAQEAAITLARRLGYVVPEPPTTPPVKE